MKIMEQDIKKIIAIFLKVDNIDSHESLFQQGVDSLNMLQILTEIESVYKIKIPYEELLISNFETVGQICKLVEKLKEGK